MDDRDPHGRHMSRFESLRDFDNRGFDRGRSALTEAIWLILSAALVRSWIPGSVHRRLILRAFGAQIGADVIIKPGVRIKFPWRLAVGDHSWIGEDVWIDNLAAVKIGSNCCVSQGAYICTGSHDWSAAAFDLTTKPVTIEDNAWIAAKAIVSPGVTVGEGAVLALGSVAMSDLGAWGIYRGAPAVFVKKRVVAAPAGDSTT
jgi:putative colanic acid biosynthesis acetyltransferase WcaF